ncbi:MAG: type II secretion system F family protein [Actinomycetota bacterium]
MKTLIAVGGATGLWLCYSGLTGASRSMASRVTPYVMDRRSEWSRTAIVSSRRGLSALLIHAFGELKPGSAEDMAARLRAAGSRLDPDDYRAEQLMWAGAAGGAAALLPSFAWMTGIQVAWSAVPLLVVIGGVTGFLARDRVLTRQTEKRRDLYVEELPVAIDLITLSLMAGGSVAAGCKQISQVMAGGIGDEFHIVWSDIRSGVTVVEALEQLASRVPNPAMTRFIDALVTGIEQGAPLADVLRAQADDSRDARHRALIEMGGRREILMLLPVVFLILPVVVIFALWPGLVTLDLLVP